MKLSDVDLTSADLFVPAVPHEMFRLLRREAPVFWQPESEGPGFYALTKYRDVATVSLSHKTFSSWRRGALLRDPQEEDLAHMQLMMLNMDPPRHTKLRLLVNKGFTPRMVTRLEPRIREQANRIIDGIAEKGEGDFVRDVAAELPLQVIADMIGIPQEDRHMVFSWSNRLIGFDDPEYATSLEDGKIASTEMYMYANELVQSRKNRGGDDLVSVLMNAEVDGERLTEMEFDVFFLLLAVAGNETTRNLISGAMQALSENPDQKQRLIDDPSLMSTAVEEMLRWVSSVMHFRRTVVHDTEIRGQKLREGDKVVIWYISANRDEEIFSNADCFDVGRTPNEHLAFGLGAHFCLGNNLARLEIRVLFEELLRRLPDIEIAGPVRRLRSNFINGIKEMPVRFTPERNVNRVAV